MRDQVIKIVADMLVLDNLPSPDADLHDLGADSLDRVEIAMVLEEEFDVEISDAEIEHAKTVADVVDLVEQKVVVDVG